MFTTGEVFVDSSVLIEAIKGAKTGLLKNLVENNKGNCFVDATVISEFMFHFLAVNSTVASLTLKMQKKSQTFFGTIKTSNSLRLSSF